MSWRIGATRTAGVARGGEPTRGDGTARGEEAGRTAISAPDAGFTLTELLITIVILGVLAGIVVFAVTGFTSDGKEAACEADRRNVQIAAEAYAIKNNGNYPTGVDDAQRINELVNDGFLRQVPSTTHGYVITLSVAGVVGPADCTPS